jgi:hypothetical protein
MFQQLPALHPTLRKCQARRKREDSRPIGPRETVVSEMCDVQRDCQSPAYPSQNSQPWQYRALPMDHQRAAPYSAIQAIMGAAIRADITSVPSALDPLMFKPYPSLQLSLTRTVYPEAM